MTATSPGVLEVATRRSDVRFVPWAEVRPALVVSMRCEVAPKFYPAASGVGEAVAELGHVVGSVVFFGVFGVMAIGLLFTPVFYVLVRRLAL